MMRFILLVVPALLVSGCGTGIKITKLDDKATSVVGAPWNLPMTQYTITITRHLTKCGSDVAGQVESLVSSGIAPDPDQRYLLSSTGWFSTSSIHSQLAANGISTSLNASSEDQTGAVIGNVIGTAAKIVVGAASLSAAYKAPGKDEPADLCQDKISKAVNELYPASGDTLEKIIKTRTQELADATAKVALLTAQVHYDKTLKGALVIALDAQSQAQKTLDKVQATFTADLKLTTNTQVVGWPLRGSEDRRDSPFEIEDSVLKDWLAVDLKSADLSLIKEKFRVFAAVLTFDASLKKWSKPLAPSAPDLKIGVPVRIARPARLMVCTGAICNPEMGETEIPTENVTIADGSALQFGTVYVVPAAGGHFKSESAAITLDASGAPTSIQIDEKVAAAAEATAAAKDAVTQLAAIPADIDAAKLARTKAKTDQLNAEAALASARATAGLSPQTAQLKAQADLIAAQSALDQARANTGLNDQTAAAAAQSALLDAQAALATAQANASTVPEKSALTAQTALINAQVAQLNAAAALAKARAELP